MTPRLPSSTALEIASVIPRSLNEPVGLTPSFLRYRIAPGTWRSRRSARSSGVSPSRSVTTGVPSETGRNGRYSSITPRQAVLLTVDHPDDVPDGADHVERFDPREHPPHLALARGVRDHHDVGVRAAALLRDRRDADAFLAEDRRDPGEDARPVGHLHQQIERRLDLFHRAERPRLEAVPADAPVPAAPVAARHVDEIRHDGARRGIAAGAAADDHHLARR